MWMTLERYQTMNMYDYVAPTKTVFPQIHFFKFLNGSFAEYQI